MNEEMNEIPNWQKRVVDGKINTGYILHEDNPRRFRLPLKMRAKASTPRWQGGDMQGMSETIGWCIISPNQDIKERIPLAVNHKGHADFYTARLKDVKSAIRKVKKEHKGEPYVAIVKNSRSTWRDSASSIDFVFLDDNTPITTHGDMWYHKRAVAHIYTYEELITRLMELESRLASFDAESAKKALEIQSMRQSLVGWVNSIEHNRKELEKANNILAHWLDEEYVKEYVAKQVQWAKDDIAQKEKRMEHNEALLARTRKQLAELTGEEEE